MPEKDYPQLLRIANLQDFTPYMKGRSDTISHLRPCFDKSAGIICGYTPAHGGGSSNGMMGVRAIARVTCRKCVAEAQSWLDNPEYWAEQKRMRSERGTLSYAVKRLDYLDRRSS